MTQLRRVLIVDDDPAIANLLAADVCGICDEVVIAGDMHEAKDRLVGRNFSHVLLDLLLPDSGVIATLSDVRHFLTHGVSHVVIMTGAFINPGIEKSTEQSGARAILSKMDPMFLQRVRAEIG